MPKLIDALVQLLKVKSLLSLIAGIVFAKMALDSKLDPKEVITVVMIVFTFFFAHQSGKKD